MTISQIFLTKQSVVDKNTSSPSAPAVFNHLDEDKEDDSSMVVEEQGDSDGSTEHGKRLKSSVWKYADKISSGIAQCNQCGKKIKTNQGGTSSLRKHLLQQHRELDLSSLKPTERTINNSISKEKKFRLDRLLTRATFEDGRSFGDFRKSGMIKFLNEAVPGKESIDQAASD